MNSKAPVCYLSVRTRNSKQEHYETSANDARTRARDLRKLGFRVTVSPLGPQVTNVGTVRMTLLTIHEPGDREIPAPTIKEQI
jgi:hypothetical protein